jgi:hypothetical protein
VSLPGLEANAASGPSFTSGDGRVVAFSSFASNLVPDDMDRFDDVYVRLQTGLLRVESRSSAGVKGNSTRLGRSAPMAGSSRSSRGPRTSSPATRTGPPSTTCSCTTA